MNWLWSWLNLDLIQKLSGIFAYVAGSFWVLMNYRRNRTHMPRLQVEVKIEPTQGFGQQFLLATCQAKNVGLSVIRLPQAQGGALPGTALRLRLLPPVPREPRMFEVQWRADIAAFDVFASHQAIEPGLTISEQKLIHLPESGYAACWAQLRVSAHGEKWSAVAVTLLQPPAPSDPKDS